MKLAIFDIDGTLVTGLSTEKRFFLELLRRGRIGPRQVLGFLWFLLRCSPRFGRHVFKKNKAYLAWLYEADVRRLAAVWAEERLTEAWFEPCVQRLYQHKQAGDRVVLLSGTPQFVAEAIGTALGVDQVIGSDCIIEDGRFRLRPPERHPFREEKRVLAEALRDEPGAGCEGVAAYGDSIYDLPLLEMADTPVAVRPDQALAAHAAAAGWEIIGPVRQPWSGVLASCLSGTITRSGTKPGAMMERTSPKIPGRRA
jgi:HAD superfamily hydrolase (TIGR01490 family)